jgi:Tfp pilus assembly protein PilV|tara:strand:+ start:52 stop:684 length:633 start_codon:yes stop_codon:yes gene_type:complete
MIKKKMNKKISGLSLLEALISTAIVGIGFVAILQMTNYSIQSIYISGERTKANYLTNVIAEDVIGNQDINTTGDNNFSNLLSQREFNSNFCQSNSGGTNNSGEIYSGTTNNTTNVEIKTNKWNALLNNKDYLNCAGRNETRNFRVFKVVSRWSQVDGLINPQQTDIDNNGSPDEPYVMDEVMYIGRVQFNLNNGKKRKFLYFQSDFELKQ